MANLANYTDEDLFLAYIRDPNSTIADDIGRTLVSRVKAKSSRDYLELFIPEDVQSEITKMIWDRSIMYGEVRTRNTPSDRIVKPFGEISVPDENQMGYYLSAKDFGIALGDLPYGDPDIFNIIFSRISSYIAVMVDQLIIRPGIQKEPTLESILTTKEVVDHPSEGMHTIGGYIENANQSVNTFDLNSIKSMLYHTPVGYRQRSKWIMNSRTLNILSHIDELKDAPNLTSPALFDNDDLIERLYDKPILINENMPDTGHPIILADLSRGYLISKRPEHMRIFSNLKTKQLYFSAQLGGRVLQAAAFKVLKYGIGSYEHEETEPKEIQKTQVLDDYDENGNVIFY